MVDKITIIQKDRQASCIISTTNMQCCNFVVSVTLTTALGHLKEIIIKTYFLIVFFFRHRDLTETLETFTHPHLSALLYICCLYL